MKQSQYDVEMLYNELQSLKQKNESMEQEILTQNKMISDLYKRNNELMYIISCLGFLNRNINEKSLLFKYYSDEFESVMQKYDLQGTRTPHTSEKIDYKKLSNELLQEFRSQRRKRVNIKDIQANHGVSYGTAYKTLKYIYNSCQKAFHWGQKRKKGKWSKINLVLKDVFAIPL